MATKPTKPTCGKCRKPKPCKCGQPTKYDPKYCDELIEFFSEVRYTKEIKKERITEHKNGTMTREVEYILVPSGLPFLSAFARKIGVCVDTLHEWANGRTGKDDDAPLKHPEFSDAYKKAKELQKEFLINNGLQGLYPPASFIFTAKNITDMRDKVETDITSGGEKLTPFEAILAAMTPTYGRKPPEIHTDDSDQTRL